MKKVILGDSEERVIEHLIESGVGESAEQIIKIAVHRLDDQQVELRLMREKVDAGMEQMRNGDVVTPSESIEDTLRAYRDRSGQNQSTR